MTVTAPQLWAGLGGRGSVPMELGPTQSEGFSVDNPLFCDHVNVALGACNIIDDAACFLKLMHVGKLTVVFQEQIRGTPG